MVDDTSVFEKEPLEQLAKDNQLVAYNHKGFWMPMDKLSDKVTLENMWNSKKAEWKIWMNNLSLFNGIYKGKKVLITGDTGFKGSWLSIWLKELGAEVFGYALPAKTVKDNFVRCNLKNIINHKDGDIRDQKFFVKYFQEVRPDIAFHLAASP